jgi:hypothetical protein
VGIHYDRGHHTREAVVTLIGPNFLRDNLRALQKATFYGVPFVSRELNNEDLRKYTKVEAGSGIHAGLPAEKRGKTVLIWGLPSEVWTKSVNSLLVGFQVAGPLQRIMYVELHRIIQDDFLILKNQKSQKQTKSNGAIFGHTPI